MFNENFLFDNHMVHGVSEELHAGPPTLAQTYEIGRKIGEGNFAIVKECIHRYNVTK